MGYGGRRTRLIVPMLALILIGIVIIIVLLLRT